MKSYCKSYCYSALLVSVDSLKYCINQHHHFFSYSLSYCNNMKSWRKIAQIFCLLILYHWSLSITSGSIKNHQSIERDQWHEMGSVIFAEMDWFQKFTRTCQQISEFDLSLQKLLGRKVEWIWQVFTVNIMMESSSGLHLVG